MRSTDVRELIVSLTTEVNRHFWSYVLVNIMFSTFLPAGSVILSMS